MEWGRSKTILILAFLALNLLLGYQLWIVKMDVLGSRYEVNERTEEIMDALEQKGIQVAVRIPKETPKTGEITVRFALTGGPAFFRQRVEEQVLMPNAINELAGQIREVDDYVYDPVLSDEGKYVMSQQYKGLPMFEVNLILYHENNQIQSYQQRYVEVVDSLKQKEQQVLSAYTAVELLAENYLQPGQTITDIRLGYHGKMFDSQTQVLAPKWRIALDDGTLYYLHAINGEVEEVPVSPSS